MPFKNTSICWDCMMPTKMNMIAHAINAAKAALRTFLAKGDLCLPKRIKS